MRIRDNACKLAGKVPGMQKYPRNGVMEPASMQTKYLLQTEGAPNPQLTCQSPNSQRDDTK